MGCIAKLRRHRGDNDRGAILIEAAFVTPVFVLILFSIIEFGIGFADRLAAEDMSLTTARIGSASGNEPLADFSIVTHVKNSKLTTGKVELVVVYKTNSPTKAVPASCLVASQTDLCNRYTPNDFAQPESKFGCGFTAIDTAWCPTTRKTALTGANGPPDYIGVFVRVSHPTVTTFFGRSWTFEFDTVIRVEPRSET